MKKRKIINDPVHGTIALEGPLLELAGTPEVMRLTGIHQLGMAYLVFPGAHHKRFEHSLGTSHVAGLLASALELPSEEAMLVRTAGLLHDLGHGPYSHTLESVFHERIGMDHMEITSELITGKVEPWDLHWWEGYEDLDRGRSIPEILESFDLDPAEVARLICQDGEAVEGEQETLHVQDGQSYFSNRRYLPQIIHSALDADQLDFLLRDSRYTGVAYGIVDLDRIVQTTILFHGEMMIRKRGISALEGMLVARSLMYSSVYFHKTARISESMMCRGARALSDHQLEELWKLSDGEVLPLMRRFGGYAGDIATRLRFRRLFKLAFGIESESITGEDTSALELRELVRGISRQNETARLEREIEKRASVPEGYVIVDVPDPSLTLSEPRLKRTDIKVHAEKVEYLSRISPLARALQKRPPVPWCLSVSCPEKYREDVKRVSKTLISV